jgi:hypothetical protein
MSLRYEQYNSLLLTKRFLGSLLTVKAYPKTRKEMREEVFRCLRHFPPLHDSGQPIWSQDYFTKDVE